jgi:hypothetical protein
MDIQATSYIAGAISPETKQAVRQAVHRFGEAFREANKPMPLVVPPDVFVPALKRAAESAKQAVHHVIEFVEKHPESLLM